MYQCTYFAYTLRRVRKLYCDYYILPAQKTVGSKTPRETRKVFNKIPVGKKTNETMRKKNRPALWSCPKPRFLVGRSENGVEKPIVVEGYDRFKYSSCTRSCPVLLETQQRYVSNSEQTPQFVPETSLEVKVWRGEGGCLVFGFYYYYYCYNLDFQQRLLYRYELGPMLRKRYQILIERRNYKTSISPNIFCSMTEIYARLEFIVVHPHYLDSS